MRSGSWSAVVASLALAVPGPAPVAAATAPAALRMAAGCQDFGAPEVYDRVTVTAQAVPSTQYAAPPPPPPPAPPAPPPPPMAGVAKAPSSIVVTGSRVGGFVPGPGPNRDRYARIDANPVKRAATEPVSTFSVDVDTAAYATVRRALCSGSLPPADAVRVEEMVNYFRYAYPLPADRRVPFAVTTDVAVTPWNPKTRLLRVALRGYDVSRTARPPANLVFLVDVSGSMDEPDKLPLVRRTLQLLTDRLQPRDRVAIVVYAGAAGVVLPSTSDKRAVIAALDRLHAGGSTAGGAGIELAYRIARQNFIRDGINRIMLATDGDFNVGVSGTRALTDLVAREKNSGVTLTTLGFGSGNYNDEMMSAVADAANGNHATIDSDNEARKVLDEELTSTLFTIAGDVKVQVEFNPATVAEYRLIGYEKRLLAEEDFGNDAVDAGDIGAGHRVTALYEVALAGSGGERLVQRRYSAPAARPAGKGGELAFVRLRYKLPGATASRLIEQPVAVTAPAAATGEAAFAASVAAFGQRLRGGKYLGGYDYPDIVRLAQASETLARDPYRRQFVALVELARRQDPGSRGRGR